MPAHPVVMYASYHHSVLIMYRHRRVARRLHRHNTVLGTPCTCSFPACAGRCSPLRTPCKRSFSDCAHKQCPDMTPRARFTPLLSLLLSPPAAPTSCSPLTPSRRISTYTLARLSCSRHNDTTLALPVSLAPAAPPALTRVQIAQALQRTTADHASRHLTNSTQTRATAPSSPAESRQSARHT